MRLEVSGDGKVIVVLDGMLERAEDLRPALLEIGEDLVESQRQRFATATTPEGVPWAPNSPVTIAAYLGLFKGSHKKDGSLSKRGEARAAAKKPGTGETKALQTTINYQLLDGNILSVGSPLVYAAMFNFGGTRAKFPNLWGDIPARQFAGVSVADRENILAVVGSYITSS